MTTLKSIGRLTILGALPAFVMMIAGSNQLAAQHTVKAGTTTTYNGAPACDCSQNTSQCGCIL